MTTPKIGFARSVVQALAFTAIAASMAAFAPRAHATVITYDLNTYYGTKPPSTGAYGTVTLTSETGGVEVTVTPATGVGFVDTGAGDSLLWDMTNSSLTISGLTTGFSVVGGTSSAGTWTVAAAGGKGIHADGSGYWDFAVTCAGTSGACAQGGSGPDTSSFSFLIDGATLTEFTTNGDGNNFASDVCIKVVSGQCAAGANTGVVSGGPSTSVPEPATLALFAAGLGGLGFALSRRRKNV